MSMIQLGLKWDSATEDLATSAAHGGRLNSSLYSLATRQQAARPLERRSFSLEGEGGRENLGGPKEATGKPQSLVQASIFQGSLLGAWPFNLPENHVLSNVAPATGNMINRGLEGDVRFRVVSERGFRLRFPDNIARHRISNFCAQQHVCNRETVFPPWLHEFHVANPDSPPAEAMVMDPFNCLDFSQT